MAGCLHVWSQHNRPWTELASWLRQAEFALDSEECVFLKSQMLIPGTLTLVNRRQNMQATIDYIIQHALVANS